MNTNISEQIKAKKIEESRLFKRKFEIETVMANQKSDWLIRQIPTPLEERLLLSEELKMVKYKIQVIKEELRELRAENAADSDSYFRVEQYWGEINKILHREGLEHFIYEARENVRDRIIVNN